MKAIRNDMDSHLTATNELTAIHLCSGYGGFELALRSRGVRTVAHVERDSYAATVLMERMEESRLDSAPIWDDLTTFDGEPWRGRVDLVTAGFPCQPFSNAGARRGLDDDRWLWPAIARIIREIRPRFVILENVPPVIRAGLPVVLSDLARLGFDAEWGLLSASEVGAPHRRQRFWLVAHSNSVRRKHSGEHLARSTGTPAPPRQPGRDTPELLGIVGEGNPLADTASSGRPQNRIDDPGNRDSTSSSRPSRDANGSRSSVADPTSTRQPTPTLNRKHGETQLAGPDGHGDSSVADPKSTRRESRSRRPTGSSSLGRPANLDDYMGEHRFPPHRNSADWNEWIASGGPEPVIRRESDGPPAGLADALHLGGNGLVPQCATEAIRQLLDRAGWDMT